MKGRGASGQRSATNSQQTKSLKWFWIKLPIGLVGKVGDQIAFLIFVLMESEISCALKRPPSLRAMNGVQIELEFLKSI